MRIIIIFFISLTFARKLSKEQPIAKKIYHILSYTDKCLKMI